MEAWAMEAWGPVGAVAVILGLIELLKWTTGHRKSQNGFGFREGDRKALDFVAHRVSTDQWSKDIHDLLGLARKNHEVLSRMADRQETYQQRLVDHFSRMECQRPGGRVGPP